MAGIVVIRLEFGTPITGIWCNACMTSGGLVVPMHQISEAGVTRRNTAYGCTTCEGPGDLETLDP